MRLRGGGISHADRRLLRPAFLSSDARTATRSARMRHVCAATNHVQHVSKDDDDTYEVPDNEIELYKLRTP